MAFKGLFTGEGIAWFTTSMGENYMGFPPLLTVVLILLAIGIAEKSVAIRFIIGGAPRWMLAYCRVCGCGWVYYGRFCFCGDSTPGGTCLQGCW